jgi:arylsulfatase A-like enzyme
VGELVSLIDVAPTLLEIAGVQIPRTFRGNSLLGLSGQVPRAWPTDVFVQVSEDIVGRAVRTERWLYSVYAPDKRGWEAPASDRYVEQHLYDLENDPWEIENLVRDPRHRAVREEMRERLLKRMREAGEREPRIVAPE